MKKIYKIFIVVFIFMYFTKSNVVNAEESINHLTEEFYGLDSIGDKEAAIDFLRNIVTSYHH